ncbi:MAG TPA: polymer-forming cytoskeletal protein [Rhizomicrobium sp.]|nr:polymer-forming cytoskeletal protein [Rhizomicrobium sp.]
MLTLTRRLEVQRPDPGPVHGEIEAPPSFIGPGVGISGVLEIDGELVVSGLIRGRIAALKLVIAAGGLVEGDIVAREVVIAGRLNGRVFAPNVTIEASAEVEGRLFHTTISVARGARMNGRTPWRPVSYFDTLDQLPENRA